MMLFTEDLIDFTGSSGTWLSLQSCPSWDEGIKYLPALC